MTIKFSAGRLHLEDDLLVIENAGLESVAYYYLSAATAVNLASALLQWATQNRSAT